MTCEYHSEKFSIYIDHRFVSGTNLLEGNAQTCLLLLLVYEMRKAPLGRTFSRRVREETNKEYVDMTRMERKRKKCEG